MEEEGLFHLYLSNSDNPQISNLHIYSRCINATSANKTIKYRDAIEDISNGKGESLYLKNIFLNPFTNEFQRADIFGCISNLEDYDQVIDDICRESFLNANLTELGSIKNISSSITNWLEVKEIALQNLKSKALPNPDDLKKIEDNFELSINKSMKI